jgi:2-oxoglutarate dehydrogenase complex dehydrogenase (E1) component-like enzyme
MSMPRELADGAFEPVLDDRGAVDKDAVKRVLVCSGKVAYDLLIEREQRKSPETAIVRLEQLYPFPEWAVSNTLGSYARAKEVAWVQEEPLNQGAWNFVRHRIADSLPFGRAVRCIGRPESPSTAAGSLRAHRREQAAIVAAAFE